MPTLFYLKAQMKIQLQVAFTILLFLISIQRVTCEHPTHASEIRWTCACSFANQETQSSIGAAANCSGSCDCQPNESTANKWTCICGQLPTLATDNQNASCFTSCNCTSGSIAGAQPSEQHISGRIVVIVLFICLILTTFAFLATLFCYFYQKEKYQPQKILSERGSSNNSGTDLIRHMPLSQPLSRTNDSFMANSLKGCNGFASLLFSKKMGMIRGTVIHFTYSELEHATNKFSDASLIGVGGSSHVYCGHLKDGRTVAVKRLKISEGLDSDSQFFREVHLISRLHHCHIVPLLGYCSRSCGKQNEKLLVFEYLPNGNLRECLDGASGKHLNWRTRVSIALGAAKALEYLHDAAAPRILHRDVKSTNILLDEMWKAKVTDLGMAKCISTDGIPSCSSSPDRIQGTFGYFAPEYAIVGKGSLKSDVFSFGVVLLELITGRTPIFNLSDKGEESLVMWAAPRLQNSKRVISELPDPHLGGDFAEEEMQIMAYLAKECLILDPESRPGMSEVVHVLSTIAPDESRRTRFSSFFQNLPRNNTKTEQQNHEKLTDQVEVIVDSEELKQMCPSKWSSRSLSTDVDCNLLADSIGQSVHLSSVQYVDRLLYLTSQGSSNTKDDDEIVDLTEPRLETFCVVNGQ